ncbi:MAG: dihydrodipicolinate synthase family protein [Alphaproteobacteria bacterium]
MSAITVNGHSSEIHACTIDDQARVLDIAVEAAGDLPVISGVYSDSTMEAARIARMATDHGASALLIFPPHSIGMGGGQARPEMARAHLSAIANATDLPLIVFQYDGPYAYRLDHLVGHCEAIPAIRAIKDKSPPPLHERTINTLQSLPRPVNVLTTCSAWLMSSLVMGARGVLSGSGSIIADLHVALWNAVQADDLTKAKDISARIYPTAQCFYSQPICDQHNRMKEALVMLGRLDGPAVVRPPLQKLGEAELDRIRAAIDAAGLDAEGASGLGNLSVAAE